MIHAIPPFAIFPDGPEWPRDRDSLTYDDDHERYYRNKSRRSLSRSSSRSHSRSRCEDDDHHHHHHQRHRPYSQHGRDATLRPGSSSARITTNDDGMYLDALGHRRLRPDANKSDNYGQEDGYEYTYASDRGRSRRHSHCHGCDRDRDYDDSSDSDSGIASDGQEYGQVHTPLPPASALRPSTAGSASRDSRRHSSYIPGAVDELRPQGAGYGYDHAPPAARALETDDSEYEDEEYDRLAGRGESGRRHSHVGGGGLAYRPRSSHGHARDPAKRKSVRFAPESDYDSGYDEYDDDDFEEGHRGRKPSFGETVDLLGDWVKDAYARVRRR